MAGTLTFGVQPIHLYQRRFTTESLEIALNDCHLYIISRRPQLRIDPDSVLSTPHGAKITIHTRSTGNGKDLSCRFVVRPSTQEPISDFKVHAAGSYFSFRVGDDLIHGDAWALTSLALGAPEDLAAQEVMYVGQAYGTSGSSSVRTRAKRHETLQLIYEDHLSDGWDVFLAPMKVSYHSLGSDDHIDDYDGGPDIFGGYYGTFVSPDDFQTVLKPTIDVVEHGLISYFVPHYNSQLLEWRASQPTQDMIRMKDHGFRLLKIHLDGWDGLSRFFSAAVPSRVRSHLITHDIPPNPRAEIKRGINSERLSTWREAASMIWTGHDQLAAATERAGVALRVFGKEAPDIRRPPEVILE